MKRRALISLTDKTGISEFAKSLCAFGFEIISTGGTAEHLRKNGVDVIDVSEITEFPECLDGRVKTLHPNIHAGLLAIRENEEHMDQIADFDITPIDLVAVNLYPFKQTIMKDGVTLDEAVENIDIGGPTMLRSAAKNWKYVTVIVDPSDYDNVINEMNMNGGEVSRETKLKLSYKVFNHTAAYDTLISTYLRKQSGSDMFPDNISFTYEKVQEMRYGENPHQNASFYKESGISLQGTLPAAVQLHGKELSYNNINDANGALDVLKEFTDVKYAVAAVKHANPCGVGISEDSLFEAYMRAYEADPVSIFGGIVALNSEVDAPTAEEMSKIFLEIIIAPSFTSEAVDILTKKKNIRLLKLDNIMKPNTKAMLDMKKVAGGLLIQELNDEIYNEDEFKYVTDKKPTDEEIKNLLFAWRVVKHTKSNAIVLAKDNATTGVGPGQTNRITALELAVKYAGEKAAGSVMASDAFFPFGDCVEAAHKAGITAIIQPGGSVRDQESIDLCNKYGIAMVFTNMRHFKH